MGEAPWISELETGAVNVTVDSALNASSNNPVQNKVVKAAIDNTLKKDGSAMADAGVFNWALGKTMSGGVIAGGWGTRYSTQNLNSYTTFEYDRIDVTRDTKHEFFELTGDGENKVVRKKDLEGLGGGGFDPNTDDIVLGRNASVDSGGSAIAIGKNAGVFCHSETSVNGGVAVGRDAIAYSSAVSIGGGVSPEGNGAEAHTKSVAIGAVAYSNDDAVAVGYCACANVRGTAIGSQATASQHTVAIGSYAGQSGGRHSVVIGDHAGYDCTCNARSAVIIGPYAEGGVTPNGNGGYYPIVIGTSCANMGEDLANATIRVDAEGNLTVGGKPVGGGGGFDPNVSNIAIGCSAAICAYETMPSVAIGECASAACGGVAVGSYAKAPMDGYCGCESVAIGYDATVYFPNSVAVGARSVAKQGAVAVGRYSFATSRSIAIGTGAATEGATGSGEEDIAIGEGAVAFGGNSVTIGNEIGNALAKSAMLSAFNPTTGTHAFLRIIAGSGCTDSYLEFGRFDTLSGSATSVKISMDNFSSLFTENGGVDDVTQGIVGGRSMYGYNGY